MDEKEVRRVVETYSDMILRISYNYLQHTFDSKDICQTVLLKYMINGETFDTEEHEVQWTSALRRPERQRRLSNGSSTAVLEQRQKRTPFTNSLSQQERETAH
ncbi:hypothetical protein SAMN04487771_10907, partial [[Clostridium] aminophilum]